LDPTSAIEQADRKFLLPRRGTGKVRSAEQSAELNVSFFNLWMTAQGTLQAPGNVGSPAGCFL
jgi:hypothetical protein